MNKKYSIILNNNSVSCILAKIFFMKTILLICFILIAGTQTFSYSPGNVKSNSSYTLPGNVNALTLQKFLTLTPKQYSQLTGKKMTLKQKIAFTVLKLKLKKQLDEGKTEQKNNLGLLSLLFGAGAWVIAFIPAIGIISLGLAAAAVILGILGLNKKKGDTKSIIGLVLGSLFISLLLVALAVFASSGWY